MSADSDIVGWSPERRQAEIDRRVAEFGRDLVCFERLVLASHSRGIPNGDGKYRLRGIADLPGYRRAETA